MKIPGPNINKMCNGDHTLPPKTKKTRVLVNLPQGFHSDPLLKPIWTRLRKRCTLRMRSHNTPEEILKDLQWADCLLWWSWPKLDDALLDRCPNIRFSAQLDIARDAAEVALRRGLPVSLAKGAWSPAVAEMALTLTLGVLRKTSNYHAAFRTGTEHWVEGLPEDVDPDERQLAGRPVGIIGFGQVGRRFRELLAPFDCPVRVYDPFIPAAAVKKGKVERVELMDLLKSSDVVVLSAASNEGTRHLLGAKQINAMRKSAVFVNVARAALVDTDALVARLQKGDMYAALDVFDKEPLPKNSPLRKLPNAYLTPHRAGGIMASVERIIDWLATDLELFLDGKERRYPLTKKMLPALDG